MLQLTIHTLQAIFCGCVPETYHMCRLQSLRQRAGAAFTDNVHLEAEFGHGRVALVMGPAPNLVHDCNHLIARTKSLRHSTFCETRFASNHIPCRCCDSHAAPCNLTHVRDILRSQCASSNCSQCEASNHVGTDPEHK